MAQKPTPNGFDDQHIDACIMRVTHEFMSPWQEGTEMPELHSVTRVGNQKSIRLGPEIKKAKIGAVRELLEQPLCIPALQVHYDCLTQPHE